MIVELGAKLRRTRESLGITQEELSKSVGLSSEFISLLEVGKRAPSLDSLRKLAVFLKKDMAYFLEEKETAFEILINDKKMSREARSEIRRFKRYCEDYLQLEDLTGRRLEAAPLYNSASPEMMAHEERERLGLGAEPVHDIFGLVEMNGLRVLKQAVTPKAQVAGVFVYFIAEQAGFALISTSLTLGEQRLIAAHEYCHFLKDRMDGPILDNADIVYEDYLPLYHPREKFAHRFAVNFLVPSLKLRHIHQKELSIRSLHFEDVIYLKRYFGVNTSLMLRRLLELELLSSQKYYEFKEIDFYDFEKSLFGNVVGDAKSVKGKGKTISSERYKILGVSAFKKGRDGKILNHIVIKTCTLNIPEIGSVFFEPSRRAKRLNITVSALRGIRVAVPNRITLKQAVSFVHIKKGWIQKNHVKIQQQEAAAKYMSFESLGMNEREAKANLKTRLAELAALYGFSFNRIFVRRQKTRWGSCSEKNNINLNLRILLLPPILQDYVLLHELVHTRIKNHSPNFWRELNRFVGDAKGLRRRLNRYPL